jgi:D-alanine-D-alanine ligase
LSSRRTWEAASASARRNHQLAEALDLAAQFDRKLLVEAAVPHARELEISVLGSDTPVASVRADRARQRFYDYSAKYIGKQRLLIRRR